MKLCVCVCVCVGVGEGVGAIQVPFNPQGKNVTQRHLTA